MAPYDAARRAAGRIPGARPIRADWGGHLTREPQEAVRAELAAFLQTAGTRAGMALRGTWQTTDGGSGGLVLVISLP